MSPPRELPPGATVALALRATPRAFAFLLGSGMSKSAGVPTGHDVLAELCRQAGYASGAKGAVDTDPIEWYASHTGGSPSYDQVLGALTQHPEERVGILRRYFEPNEDEVRQKLKIPSEGHRALARLAQLGLISVILTTNFDRLIEHSLDDAGVPYVVTATPEAVAGALPLHLQSCQVVKLHGDYLDPGMLNTTNELSSYDPRIDHLLDRVLCDYGLIVIGWSAKYDVALRRAIERTPSRRFSSWWVDPATLSDEAARLIALRSPAVVKLTGDAFLVAVPYSPP